MSLDELGDRYLLLGLGTGHMHVIEIPDMDSISEEALSQESRGTFTQLGDEEVKGQVEENREECRWGGGGVGACVVAALPTHQRFEEMPDRCDQDVQLLFGAGWMDGTIGIFRVEAASVPLQCLARPRILERRRSRRDSDTSFWSVLKLVRGDPAHPIISVRFIYERSNQSNNGSGYGKTFLVATSCSGRSYFVDSARFCSATKREDVLSSGHPSDSHVDSEKGILYFDLGAHLRAAGSRAAGMITHAEVVLISDEGGIRDEVGASSRSDALLYVTNCVHLMSVTHLFGYLSGMTMRSEVPMIRSKSELFHYKSLRT